MPRIGPFATIACFCACALTGQAQPATGTAEFRNINRTFHLDLPAGWRQLAPNEARAVSSLPNAPAHLGYVEPRQFYAVGPVEAWLQGNFEGPWLWVVEQSNEWEVSDDFAAQLEAMWQEKGAASATTYQLSDVGKRPVGVQERVAITAMRTSVPSAGKTTKSLDVHAPSGGQQISLSFTCDADEWSRWQPEFDRWLATLTFARAARQERSVGDRLWTPILTGAGVGLILLLLYKHSRRRG